MSAHFKLPKVPSRSMSIRQRLSQLASGSRGLSPQPSTSISTSTSHQVEPQRISHRLRPHHSSTSSDASLSTVNLNQPSSENIRRSSSTSSLNMQNSASLMQEMGSLHRQAARTLNIAQTNGQNSLRHRLIPNSHQIKKVGNYLKNAAIGSGGIGGFIVTANAFSNKKNSEEIRNVTILNITKTTTTKSTTTTTPFPEIYNPIGEDK